MTTPQTTDTAPQQDIVSIAMRRYKAVAAVQALRNLLDSNGNHRAGVSEQDIAQAVSNLLESQE